MKHYIRYETYVGAKMTETLIESYLSFATKALSMAVRIKDSDALQNELENDNIITKELSALSGRLVLRCGCLLAEATAFLISAKHVDFSSDEVTKESTVDKAEQSSVNAEKLVNIGG